MAAERHPPDAHAHAHAHAHALISTAPVPTTISAASPDASLLDHPTTTNPPKRQRRPSVRLGDIGGDPPYDSHIRRPNKTWRFHKDPTFAAQNSKTRPLTNLVNDGGDVEDESNFQDTVEPADYADFSHRKPKNKRPSKRARTSWNNKFESTTINNGGSGAGGGGVIESTNIFQEDSQNNNEEFREFEPEGSESPLLKEQQSPVNSMENMGLQFWDQQRRGNSVRGLESNGVLHNVVNSPEKRNEGSVGIRQWLNGLGLRRYAPVFEIHEVDDEVLPMLTLEDLKDMGINAVGSRRKMYSSILKMRKGFS